MRFRITPQAEDIGGQDFVEAGFPSIERAAAELRSIFPNRSGSESVVIDRIDRDSPDVDESNYGIFELGTGIRQV
jgi:regulator of RNase E activity RraA